MLLCRFFNHIPTSLYHTFACENISSMPSSKKANIGENGTDCDSRSTLLTDMVNCSYSMETDEFGALFASQNFRIVMCHVGIIKLACRAQRYADKLK